MSSRAWRAAARVERELARIGPEPRALSVRPHAHDVRAPVLLPVRMEDALRHWLLQTLAMMITALLIPRLRITSIIGAIGIVVALAFVNATLWSAALFFSVPTSPTVEALVLVLANGAIFWVLCKLMPGIEIEGVLPALVAPIVFTFISILVAHYANEIDLDAVGEAVAETIGRLRAWIEQSRSGA